MQWKKLSFGALLGIITAFPIMAIFYLGEQLAGFPFVPFDLLDWLARVLPGEVITVGIDAIVRLIDTFNLGRTDTTAKIIEQLQAIGMFLGAAALIGAIITFRIQRSKENRTGTGLGAEVGVIFFALIALVELSLTGFTLFFSFIPALIWLGVILIGWGALLGRWLVPQTTVFDETGKAARRDLLVKLLGSSALLAIGSWSLGRLFSSGGEETGAGESLANLQTELPQATLVAAPEPTPNPLVESLPETRGDFVQVAGTRAEVTPDGEFYRIDINTRPIEIDGESWVLQVEGLFDNPRPLTLHDLMTNFPAVTQTITIGCISNRVGGDLISTAHWTGVRLVDLMTEFGLRPEAKELFIEAQDGFFESVAMKDLMDPRTLLVYGMNGQTLPIRHGFPLRIYIPNRYGMKQPKWITRIEAIDEEGPGYWVQRGWSAKAHPQIVSVIDSVAQNDEVEGKIPVGGIAWAGDRGIVKVEVQVDGGAWEQATLLSPTLSGLTWTLWRYEWPRQSGRHTFRVRATDGTGTLQIEERQPVRPDGATGYHSYEASIA